MRRQVDAGLAVCARCGEPIVRTYCPHLERGGLYPGLATPAPQHRSPRYHGSVTWSPNLGMCRVRDVAGEVMCELLPRCPAIYEYT